MYYMPSVTCAGMSRDSEGFSCMHWPIFEPNTCLNGNGNWFIFYPHVRHSSLHVHVITSTSGVSNIGDSNLALHGLSLTVRTLFAPL